MLQYIRQITQKKQVFFYKKERKNSGRDKPENQSFIVPGKIYSVKVLNVLLP